jgi:hypothetical protein
MYYLKFSIFIYRERTRKRRGKSEVPFEMHKRNGCFSAHKNYGKTNIIKKISMFFLKKLLTRDIKSWYNLNGELKNKKLK